MKDHEIAVLVNDLRDIALKYHAAQSLREVIHNRVVPEIERLRNDIQVLMHEGRQCELEQANTDLAQESHELQTALLQIQVESSFFRVHPPMTKKDFMEKFELIAELADKALERFKLDEEIE